MQPRRYRNVSIHDPRVEIAFFCLEIGTADDETVTFSGGFLEGIIVERAHGREIYFVVRMHLPVRPRSIRVDTGSGVDAHSEEVAVAWTDGHPTLLVHRITMDGATAGELDVAVHVDDDLAAVGTVTFAHELAVPDDLSGL